MLDIGREVFESEVRWMFGNIGIFLWVGIVFNCFLGVLLLVDLWEVCLVEIIG